MAMSSRDAKLRRLEEIKRKVPQVSAAALAGLLQEIDDHGAPDLHQRKHVRECAEKALNCHNSYGSLVSECILQGTDNKPVKLLLVNFFSLLQALVGQGGSFEELLQAAIQQHPASFHLFVYADEVNPGNPLAPDPTRKLWLIYLSFQEFGPTSLSQEEAWLPVACQRTEAVNSLAGGISQLTGLVLENIFCHEAYDPMDTGILLKGPNIGQIRLKFELGAFVADGGAHKYLFSVKGDGGIRPCILCKKIISAATKDLDDEDAILTSDVFQECDLQFTTENDWRRTLLRLLEKQDALSASDFDCWQKACGITFNPHAMIFNHKLVHIVKPISQWMHDWMHGLLVKGVWLLGSMCICCSVHFCIL